MIKKIFSIFIVFAIFLPSIFSNDLITTESSNIAKFTLNFDDLSRNVIKENNNKVIDTFSNVLTTYDYFFLFFAPISGYGASYLLNDDKLKEVSKDSIISSIISSSITMITKIFFGRERPYSEKGSFSFKPFAPLTEGSTYTSFPSGHSAVAWAVYTPYAIEYTACLYSIPIGISFSRIYEDKHWLSDVIVGSLIGYSVGYYMYYR